MKRRRGFVQLAILHLLQEQSMHGYQIMKALEERSDGLYNASAGTVYPALQELLENEMIVLQDEKSDKKVYSISKIGENHLKTFVEKEEGDFWGEWKERQVWQNSKESAQLKEAMNQWDVELRKTIKVLRKDPTSSVKLVQFIEETTERLKREFK